MIFVLIAGGLLVLNVAQAWLREMIKVQSREWLTKDLINVWMTPGRAARVAHAGEIGINPDQRIHEDARRLTELSAEFGIGLFQSTLLLFSFIGVLWGLSSGIVLHIGGRELHHPRLHGVGGPHLCGHRLLAHMGGGPTAWSASIRSALRARPICALRSSRPMNMPTASPSTSARRRRRSVSILDLDRVLAMMRSIVGATAKLTWVTAGYGWISLVAPIVIAAPGYFGGQLSFGELMMAVGAFFQVNQSLRWFVDNFANLAEWRAILHRVMKFREVLLTFESKLEAGPRIEYVPSTAGQAWARSCRRRRRHGEEAMVATSQGRCRPWRPRHGSRSDQVGQEPILAGARRPLALWQRAPRSSRAMKRRCS